MEWYSAISDLCSDSMTTMGQTLQDVHCPTNSGVVVTAGADLVSEEVRRKS